MTELVVMSGQNKGRWFPVNGDAVVVGRSPENQIQIPDESVSRKHMKILRRLGKHFLVDLSSTNGTFIDGRPLEPGKEYPLEEGVPVTVGKVVVCLGAPGESGVLAVEESIDLDDGLNDTGVLNRSRTSPRNLELIYKVSNALMQSLNINEIFENVLNYVFELLQRIDRGVIILVESESGRILDVISKHSDKWDRATKEYSTTIVERVIRERKPLVMSDTLHEGRDLSESMEIMKVRSVMCVPLISRSQIRGVLYVDSVDKPYGFRKEDLSLLTALSGPAAMAIENALLYSNLERLVAERTKTLQDIQDKLRESEVRFKGVFDNMSNGVFVLKPLDEGRDFTVLGINNACRTLEGIKDKEEAIGKSILEVFPEMELSGLLDAMRRVWEGGNSELCSVSRNDGDKLIWCREYYVYKLRSGEIVTIFEDLTQRKKAEEEQMALQRQLVFSQKMESIGAFASGIAHNFRNILQAISGNTEYMEMTHSGETDITEVARCIHESVEKGVDLINNLLHFSRKGGDCELSDMDLCDAINSACEIIRKVFDKGIAITLDLEEGLMIKGNHSLLDQVFLNLFTNARDAMPNGGRLVIRAKRIAGSAVVTVKDTGIGIEPGVLGKIFDPFFTLKEVGKGSGLGLSTTLGIVQQHNGSITVSSEPDVGTTFKITLPSIDAVKVPAPEPQKRFVYGKGEKILIVDDDRTSLQALTNLTRKLRYETIPVDNPAQALKGYAAWSPDLTIMDRNMPGMDGVTCIREILKIDPDARVLIISGYDEDGLGGIDKSTKESIKGYLTKPCVIEDLSFQIYRALRGR